MWKQIRRTIVLFVCYFWVFQHVFHHELQNVNESFFFEKNTVVRKCANMVLKLHTMSRKPNLENAVGDEKGIENKIF